MTRSAEVDAERGGCPYRVEDLPVADQRLQAWSQVREPGTVYELDGVYYATSAAACRFVTRNPEVFSSASHGDTLNAPTPYIPGGIDPPEHLGYRQTIDRRFAPKVLTAMEEPLRARLAELIEPLAARGRCDIMADLAEIFPAEVFLHIFGLPVEHREMLASWVHATLVGAYEGDPQSAVDAKDELYAYLEDVFARARTRPGDDFLHYILTQGWSDAEVMGTAFNVIQGGLDTMTGAIGLIFHYLARHPDLRRQVVQEPTTIGSIVDEILRIETPVPFSNRVTTRDVELDGVAIPAGAHVRVCYASANTDPDTFDTPHEVDTSQSRRRDIFTFGGGTHRCLGSHLARTELRLVLEEFHARIPDYRLADDAAPAARWPSVVVTLDRVPLVFPVGSTA